MKKENKVVLWGSPKHWTTTAPVGSHGYARQFASRNWTVLFVSSPITPLHRFMAVDKQLYKERRDIHRKGGNWFEEGKVWDYVPWSVVPSKQLPNCWLRWSLGDFDRALRRNGLGKIPDVVWIDNPEFGELFRKYPQAKRILRIADRNQGLKEFTRRMLRQQYELAQEADLVIVTSFSLEKELAGQGIKRLIRVPNGVDLDRFQPQTVPNRPIEFQPISQPIAVFVGMVSHWFDIEVLKKTAELLPEINFVIIGRVGIDIHKLQNRPNIFFLGQRPPETIPAYLYHADVGIIPFEQSRFSDAINPVKYFEYAACGLPVVASNTLEFRKLGEPVFLASDEAEFAEGILQALKRDKSYRRSLQDKAKGMSWEKRWQTIMENI